jgi:hypothetical protein
MENFTLGDLMILELALLQLIEKTDLSTQIGIQLLDLLGKCEKGLRELSASQSASPASAPLQPPAPSGD